MDVEEKEEEEGTCYANAPEASSSGNDTGAEAGTNKS